MEIDAFQMEDLLSFAGALEGMRCGYIKSRMDKVLAVKLESEDEYFNLLISLSEYSFAAFTKDIRHCPLGSDTTCGDGSFNNLFHYDYSNNVDYSFICDCLSNPLIRTPVYEDYCVKHKDDAPGLCFDCLERYRVVTRNLIPLMKTLRKDLCSIYFVDVLYDLIRFENRNLYAFIVYVVNEFRDGSSFQVGAQEAVPSELVVVGYQVGDQYRIDILETNAILVFLGDRRFQIASHPLLEGLNYGFYDARVDAYRTTNNLDRRIKKKLRKLFAGFRFDGRSVFSGRIIRSEDVIVVGFLKKSENTFQNFRLDIHIESIIPNGASVDSMRFIKHSKWSFEDNEADACYMQQTE